MSLDAYLAAVRFSTGAGSAELETLDGSLCFRDGFRDVFGVMGYGLARRPDLEVLVKIGRLTL